MGEALAVACRFGGLLMDGSLQGARRWAPTWAAMGPGRNSTACPIAPFDQFAWVDRPGGPAGGLEIS